MCLRGSSQLRRRPVMQARHWKWFFYKAVLKAQVGAIEAGRSRRPEHVRKALTIEEQGTRNEEQGT